MEMYMWHHDLGTWLDYDWHNRQRRNNFYLSNLTPLWTKCYNEENIKHDIMSIIVYLKNNNITFYKGGLPTSVKKSGEKYDLPYTWPYFLHIVVIGLNDTDVPIAKHLAYFIARQWMKAVYQSYKRNKAIFDSYDANKLGERAFGLQTARDVYGWTNGVILDILHRYNRFLSGSNLVKSIAIVILLPILIIYIY